MRTLQEKYNGIQEGKFSKENFLADARKELPNLITRFNGYSDAVQILKNKGMIVEAYSAEESFKDYSNHALTDMIINLSRYEDNEDSIARVKAELARRRETLQEARLTKNNLTDYRYKPTNEMDKYPYEQILRGIRVELEVAEVFGTPTAEEYAKALAKVSKNLAKDSIFYTNQLAGVNTKVDLHDKMVDATAKNTVDTFNGMKKAQLKEAIKGVIKNILTEGSEFGEGEEVYKMQEGKTEAEYVAELDDYLNDNQMQQMKDKLYTILTDPNEETVGDKLWSFLEDYEKVEHYKNLMAIFRDYANKDYPEDDEIDYDDENFSDPFIDGDEADDIPHPRGYEEASDEETEEDLYKEEKSEKDLRAEWEKYQATCHPEDRMSYMEWRSEQGLNEAIDTEADKNMVRKLMTMYETEPSKFEKLHKQAQTQAATTKDIKFKHLLSLLNRAKAGALQSLSNQDRYQAGIEGMDEIATDITGFPKWRELGQDEKDHISKFVKDTGDRDQAEYEKRKAERLKAQSARLGAYISGKKDLEEDIFESVSLKDIL